MANRIRNERLEIKLTEEEKALFEEKKRLAKCRNMSHFIRKCVLEKEIYQVNLEPFRDLQGLSICDRSDAAADSGFSISASKICSVAS